MNSLDRDAVRVARPVSSALAWPDRAAALLVRAEIPDGDDTPPARVHAPNTTMALRSTTAMAWRTRMSSSGFTVMLSDRTDSSPGSWLHFHPGLAGIHPGLILLAVDHVELA
jgi:hypothetical protein